MLQRVAHSVVILCKPPVVWTLWFHFTSLLVTIITIIYSSFLSIILFSVFWHEKNSIVECKLCGACDFLKKKNKKKNKIYSTISLWLMYYLCFNTMLAFHFSFCYFNEWFTSCKSFDVWTVMVLHNINMNIYWCNNWAKFKLIMMQIHTNSIYKSSNSERLCLYLHLILSICNIHIM